MSTEPSHTQTLKGTQETIMFQSKGQRSQEKPAEQSLPCILPCYFINAKLTHGTSLESLLESSLWQSMPNSCTDEPVEVTRSKLPPFVTYGWLCLPRWFNKKPPWNIMEMGQTTFTTSSSTFIIFPLNHSVRARTKYFIPIWFQTWKLWGFILNAQI